MSTLSWLRTFISDGCKDMARGFGEIYVRRPVALVTGLVVGFFLFFSWSTLQFHKGIPLDDWHHHLRADAAGYYIYLPGALHHKMKARSVDPLLLERAGHGFKLDLDADRIRTKYTYGAALLMAPFYLVAEAIEGYGATHGWTRNHYRLMEVSGVFYMALGSWFLFMVLLRWRGAFGAAFFTMILVLFGTNVFYYGFRTPAFSHIYSFCLVSLALYCIFKDDRPRLSWGWRIIFVLSTSLLVVIRPLDVIAVAGIFLLLLKQRPAEFRQGAIYLAMPAAFALMALPQMIYWHHLTGEWIYYSYGQEGFTFWREPRSKEVLFAPGNGLLMNAPAFALMPLGLLVLFRNDRFLALVVLGVTAVVLYACASWHAWHFGCSYGQRSLVQYTPFLAFAIHPLITYTFHRLPRLYYGAMPILVIVTYVNYRAMLNFSTCYGWGVWNWYHYQQNIISAFFGRTYIDPWCPPPEDQ